VGGRLQRDVRCRPPSARHDALQVRRGDLSHQDSALQLPETFTPFPSGRSISPHGETLVVHFHPFSTTSYHFRWKEKCGQAENRAECPLKQGFGVRGALPFFPSEQAGAGIYEARADRSLSAHFDACIEGGLGSPPISRVLSRSLATAGQSFLWSLCCHRALAAYPGATRATPLHPYLALPRMGFTVPVLSPVLR